jgi:hypothetical protein
MRRWLVFLVIVVGAILLGRRLAGWLRENMQSLPERMMSHMQQMMEKMPEDSP